MHQLNFHTNYAVSIIIIPSSRPRNPAALKGQVICPASQAGECDLNPSHLTAKPKTLPVATVANAYALAGFQQHKLILSQV